MTGLLLPNITYLSCPLCHGARIWSTEGDPCQSCADPDLARVRWMLPRLKVEQIDMLRALEHTLAEQPMTQDEYDAHRCEFFVEDEQTGELDQDDGGWLISPDRHWFAGGHSQFGPCGNINFIKLYPAGLILRDALMCAATAVIPHMYPPRSEAVEPPSSAA